MHPDIAIEFARLHGAELRTAAAGRRARPVRRLAVRVRLGQALVRWGQRLAAPPPTARHGQSPATMGT